MVGHHGFCELDFFDLARFYNSVGAIGRAHGQVASNPRRVDKGQLGHCRGILDAPRGKAREQMVNHDMLWSCAFESF